MAASQKVDYVFECVDLDTYELHFMFKADNKLFKYIFGKSRKRLAKKGVVVESVDGVEEFKLPDRFKGLVKTYINKWFRDVEASVYGDNVRLLKGWSVEECDFKRVGDGWDIDILVVGRYA